MLGVCNGFQILCEAGLLPGVLMRNSQLRFICKMQHVRVENTQTAFTRGYLPGQVVKFAIAHGEGNFVADDDTIRRIEAEGRVAFRYCDAEGRVGDASNPNGAINSIAGVFNDRLNVLGLMPHPENLIDPLVGGRRWTRAVRLPCGVKSRAPVLVDAQASPDRLELGDRPQEIPCSAEKFRGGSLFVIVRERLSGIIGFE